LLKISTDADSDPFLFVSRSIGASDLGKRRWVLRKTLKKIEKIRKNILFVILIFQFFCKTVLNFGCLYFLSQRLFAKYAPPAPLTPPTTEDKNQIQPGTAMITSNFFVYGATKFAC
jgi:hypothetical protein